MKKLLVNFNKSTHGSETDFIQYANTRKLIMLSQIDIMQVTTAVISSAESRIQCR